MAGQLFAPMAAGLGKPYAFNRSLIWGWIAQGPGPELR